MARWSRRRGPLVNFVLTAAFQTIPGLTLTRHFAGTPLLIFFTFEAQNTGAAMDFFLARILIDGVAAFPFEYGYDLSVNQELQFSISNFVTITPGRHTIEIQAGTQATPNTTITALSGELTVIELPQWDSESDILS